MTVYLLHYNEPLVGKQAVAGRGKIMRVSHYIGSTEGDLADRIAEHAKTRWEELPEPELTKRGTTRRGVRYGQGAVVVAAANSAGIAWRVSRTWPGGTDEEYALKARHNHGDYCPICHPKLAPHAYTGPLLCNSNWVEQMAVPLTQASFADTVAPIVRRYIPF